MPWLNGQAPLLVVQRQRSRVAHWGCHAENTEAESSQPWLRQQKQHCCPADIDTGGTEARQWPRGRCQDTSTVAPSHAAPARVLFQCQTTDAPGRGSYSLSPGHLITEGEIDSAGASEVEGEDFPQWDDRGRGGGPITPHGDGSRCWSLPRSCGNAVGDSLSWERGERLGLGFYWASEEERGPGQDFDLSQLGQSNGPGLA
jgi:hypothetical protein